MVCWSGLSNAGWRRGDSARTVTTASAAGRANQSALQIALCDGQRPDQSRGRTAHLFLGHGCSTPAIPLRQRTTGPQSRQLAKMLPVQRPSHDQATIDVILGHDVAGVLALTEPRRAPAPYQRSQPRPAKVTLSDRRTHLWASATSAGRPNRFVGDDDRSTRM